MRKKLYIIGLIVAGILISCDILGPPGSSVDLDYPTTFTPLSAARLDSLEALMADLNPSQYCGGLDSFGFSGVERCHVADSGQALSESEALAIAFDAVLRNEQFTNVTDTAALSIERIFADNDSATWYITFGEQQYREKTVLDTKIDVILNARGAYNIVNHWYPPCYIPDDIVYDSTTAKSRLIGRTLPYCGFGGEEHTVIITDSSLNRFKTEQQILPYSSETGAMEMRVVWRIPVDYLGDRPSWYLYTDVMTGRILRTEQLFRTLNVR